MKARTLITLIALMGSTPFCAPTWSQTLDGAIRPRASMPAAAIPVTPTSTDIRWEIKREDTRLYDAFVRWANKAGYQLRWDATRHVLVSSTQSFVGSIEQAMIAALETPGILNSEYPLEVCFYANTPPLARVTRQGEQVRDCR